MNYKLLWKIALGIVIAISVILFAPSLLKIYELSDSLIRILGTADILALSFLVFAFVKSNIKAE